MGQRERVVRLMHEAISGSGLFGSGDTARIAMSYAPLVEGFPFCVYDINAVEFLGEDNDPADQIVSFEVSVQVFSSDGFTAAKVMDGLHDHLLASDLVLASTSLRTISEDYTAIGDRPRGLVRMEAVYTIDAS